MKQLSILRILFLIFYSNIAFSLSPIAENADAMAKQFLEKGLADHVTLADPQEFMKFDYYHIVPGDEHGLTFLPEYSYMKNKDFNIETILTVEIDWGDNTFDTLAVNGEKSYIKHQYNGPDTETVYNIRMKVITTVGEYIEHARAVVSKDPETIKKSSRVRPSLVFWKSDCPGFLEGDICYEWIDVEHTTPLVDREVNLNESVNSSGIGIWTDSPVSHYGEVTHEELIPVCPGVFVNGVCSYVEIIPGSPAIPGTPGTPGTPAIPATDPQPGGPDLRLASFTTEDDGKLFATAETGSVIDYVYQSWSMDLLTGDCDILCFCRTPATSPPSVLAFNSSDPDIIQFQVFYIFCTWHWEIYYCINTDLVETGGQYYCNHGTLPDTPGTPYIPAVPGTPATPGTPAVPDEEVVTPVTDPSYTNCDEVTERALTDNLNIPLLSVSGKAVCVENVVAHDICYEPWLYRPGTCYQIIPEKFYVDDQNAPGGTYNPRDDE